MELEEKLEQPEQPKIEELVTDAPEEAASRPNHALFALSGIIIAGLIAGVWVVYNKTPILEPVINDPIAEATAAPAAESVGNTQTLTVQRTVTIKKVLETEHILGSFDAPVKVVEYSDLECPFCKDFHMVMKEIIEEYGPSGKVAWVYRHLPLTIHPKAFKEAEATECANELGGNFKFWQYTDRIFQITKSNNTLDPKELINTAEYLNLDIDKFSLCLNSSKYTKFIEESVKSAQEAGARGTPYSIVIFNGSQAFPIEGSVKYPKLKEIIESALKS